MHLIRLTSIRNFPLFFYKHPTVIMMMVIIDGCGILTGNNEYGDFIDKYNFDWGKANALDISLSVL
jgi:hypothetical protein